LAALEVIVHNGAIPADYRIITIELPDTITVEHVEDDRLPKDWPLETSANLTASLGTEWAKSLRTALLRVPSAIFPAECNYILNPWHPEFLSIRFDDRQVEYIDRRIVR
jgi:RES domain-containing protein